MSGHLGEGWSWAQTVLCGRERAAALVDGHPRRTGPRESGRRTSAMKSTVAPWPTTTIRGNHPLAGTEAEHLVGALDRLRTTFRWKADDLDSAGLQTRIGASSLTLGGLLKHLARVHRCAGAAGREPPARPAIRHLGQFCGHRNAPVATPQSRRSAGSVATAAASSRAGASTVDKWRRSPNPPDRPGRFAASNATGGSGYVDSSPPTPTPDQERSIQEEGGLRPGLRPAGHDR